MDIAPEHAKSTSGARARLIDAGLRMAGHPGIVFRHGPSERRAGLAAGPDVWEVVALLRGIPGTIDQRVAKAARQLGLAAGQVRVASRYYAEFPDEIDTQIVSNEEAADRELALWEAERRLLSG